MRLLIALVSSLLFAASASAQNRFVYLNNQSQPNAISAFQINADGSLAQITGSPFSTGGQGYASPMESMAIAYAKTIPILYAANGGDPSVSALTIDSKTGNLAPVAGSPFPILNDSTGTYDMAASPDNRFLFVTNSGTTVIHVYAISPETGALTEVSGSPFAADANVNGLNVTASGKFLLAAGNSNEGVQGPLEVFAISSTGAITQVPGSPFAANASVSDIRSNCASDRVFTADNGSAYDDAYTMSKDGTLTSVPSSPFYNGATGNGPNSWDLAIAPNGKFVFTSDSFSGDITTFVVSPDGELSQANNSPFNTGVWLGGITVTARGDYLYYTTFPYEPVVTGLRINPDGSLSPVSGASGTGVFAPDGESVSVISYPPPTCM
jgi:6-phosphogluconolactonase